MFAFFTPSLGLIVTKQWWDSHWEAPSPPSIVHDILQEATMPVRPVHLKNTSSSIEDVTWSLPETLTEISEWTRKMSEDVFEMGSVIEKFVYVYSLVMVAGPGGAVDDPWCHKAIEHVKGWLIHLM